MLEGSRLLKFRFRRVSFVGNVESWKDAIKSCKHLHTFIVILAASI